jgi:hypothetical protein
VIVLDTTVLLYAKGIDHPLREPSRRLMVLPCSSAQALVSADSAFASVATLNHATPDE